MSAEKGPGQVAIYIGPMGLLCSDAGCNERARWVYRDGETNVIELLCPHHIRSRQAPMAPTCAPPGAPGAGDQGLEIREAMKDKIRDFVAEHKRTC